MVQLEGIHLVDTPAIGETWILLAEQDFPIAFSASSDEQRIITGPVLIPDLPIKRYQPVTKGGQPIMFYAVADKETVLSTAKMYSRNHKLNDVGIMHKNIYPEGVHMFQSFITNSELGVNPPKGWEHVPDGTWFMSFLVDNNEVWDDAKAGKLNGFSIQALFGLEPMDDDAAQAAENAAVLDDAIAALQKIANKIGAAIQ